MNTAREDLASVAEGPDGSQVKPIPMPPAAGAPYAGPNAPSVQEQQKPHGVPDDIKAPGKPTGRKIFVVRSGERLDRIKPEWLKEAFKNNGSYQPYDLNMPIKLPKREKPEDFFNDSPITEIGYMVSQMVGRAFLTQKHRVSHIISSPAYRCVQSAHAFWAGFTGGVKSDTQRGKLRIAVEPGFFDWVGFYEKQKPALFSVKQLADSGIPVDETYDPYFPMEQLLKRKREYDADFGNRVHDCIEHILEKEKGATGIVIVTHATVMDAVTRKLRNKVVRSMDKTEMERMGLHYPYCSTVAIEELDNGTWRTISRPIPHCSFQNMTSEIDWTRFNKSD